MDSKTELPTEEGWYWVANSKYPKQAPVVVKVYKNSWYDNGLSIDVGDMAINTPVENEGDLWLGPLSIPEMPKGKQNADFEMVDVDGNPKRIGLFVVLKNINGGMELCADGRIVIHLLPAKDSNERPDEATKADG